MFAHVCGLKEPRGSVRVLGKGPTPQDVGTPGAHNKLPTRLQLEIEAHRQTQEVVNALTQRMDHMQQRFDQMEQMLLSQRVQNIETSSHHASNSRHVEVKLHNVTYELQKKKPNFRCKVFTNCDHTLHL